ncbi:cobalamin B12-binding domain-containing protein [Aquisalimonas sp.]|uniref:cobalamin B12-binding domain-containing protein n=1 Tax=Aquisalimonas sp. TaxID=1872621 RepID=UPI0025BC7D70|nr:cobalamin B12-binding domain-containing protein [Aquisalimonas sp.]
MVSEGVEIPLGDGMAAAKAVEGHRASAVETVTEGIYRELDEELAPFGQYGKNYCRQDIHSHLDYLAGSLVAGSSAPFGDYLVWLQGLLRARHVPANSVALSADLLADYFRDRLSPDQYRAVGSVIEGGKRGLTGASDTVATFRSSATVEHDPASANSLAHSLATGNQTEARALIDSAARNEGYLGMAVGLLQPALYRIGELWQAREISVAQEHLATALAQRLLVHHFALAPIAPPRGAKAMFASVAHNHHALGLRMVADAYELDGWSVEFLGADTPTGDLLERIEQVNPELVGLSVSMVRQLPQLKEATDRIRARFGGQSPRIVAGGLGFIRISEVADRLGLDGWSSTALTAIEGS